MSAEETNTARRITHLRWLQYFFSVHCFKYDRFSAATQQHIAGVTPNRKQKHCFPSAGIVKKGVSRRGLMKAICENSLQRASVNIFCNANLL